MIRAENSSQVEIGPDAGTVTIADESAKVCGVIGCTESGQLLRVETDEAVRVLCPKHVPRWLSDD